MAITPLYDFEDLLYETAGWNGIVQSNFEKVEAYMFTRFIGELGEDCDEGEAVYIKSDGNIWLAQANGTDQASVGLMIEDGLDGDDKRFITRGLITNSGWSWTVGSDSPIYLSSTVAGGLTQTAPGSNEQVMGFAITSTTILLTPIWPGAVGALPASPVLSGFQTGVLSSSELLARKPFSEDFTFPSGLADSYMVATTGAAAATTITLYKNGSSFATVAFLAQLTIDAAAATDKTGGKVGIPVTGHGLSTGEKIEISGTTNYDGSYVVDGDSSTDEIVIVETYTAETFGGTETIDMLWGEFTCASDSAHTAGDDIFTMSGPSTADTSLAGLAWEIQGS